MQKLATYLLALFLINSCSTSKKAAEQERSPLIYSEGMRLIDSENFPLSSNATTGVAKIMKGNTFSSSAIFISKDGLLLTNYSNAIDYFTSTSNASKSTFTDGFIANNRNEEVPFGGLSILIEIEQIDVTDVIKSQITKNSSNFEIEQIVNAAKKKLIEETQGENPDLLVQINDVYSRNRHLMSVYQIVRDLRLVFAPAVQIDNTNAVDSDQILDAVSNEFVLLRAYASANGLTQSFSPSNIPFTPNHTFTLADETLKSGTLTALGFPTRTYRLDSQRAFDFYHNRTNPYILSSYEAFLAKEDSISSTDLNYAYKSLGNRLSMARNVSFYHKIQKNFKENELLKLKNEDEALFKSWVAADSSREARYTGILYYIDQAYDIAEQTGDIFYVTAYFQNLSRLDDLANLFTPYLRAIESGKSAEELSSDLEELISHQKNVLNQLNVGGETFLLKHFVEVLKSVHEDQQPLLIFDLFYDADKKDLPSLISGFIQKQTEKSFLLNPQETKSALSSGSVYSDSLYLLLDEISTTLETARSNFSKHYTYLFPAQQYFVRGRIEQKGSSSTHPDANTTLRYNIGSYLDNRSVESDAFFYTSIDFSGRAPGSAVLNSSGKLLGMISEEINSSVLSNYYYTKQESYTKALKTSFILDKIRSVPNGEYLLKEISPE